MRHWRLLLDEAASGARNMAVDEAILEAYRAGEAPPTLRLYDWATPTLSLGYAQKASDVAFDACAARGVEVVRRPTGGRAVLHGVGDLTYAVVASGAEGFPESVADSYCLIAKALIASLQTLGLDAELTPGVRSNGNTSACFATSTKADLTASGLKVVGSAQVRRQGSFLQHGTLMLTQEADAIAPLLVSGTPPKGMASLSALSDAAIDAKAVRQALVEGFARAFGIELQAGPLTPYEEALAQKLEAAPIRGV
ncbi:lipoate--protein ligase family protein [bacterium]|nr:lipoate--protein ligase family protein [bacterium]